jgi:ABC-2 type transport system permease protein
MWERIRQMMRKEFIELFRDPRMRGTVLIPPLLQLLIFGYTVNLDIENSRIAFMDQDRSPASRELLSRFQGSPRFDIVAAPRNEAEVQDLLDGSKVVAVVRVMPNFERAILRGEPAPVQILVDGTNSNTGNLVSGYATGVIQQFAAQAGAQQQGPKMFSKMGLYTSGPSGPGGPGGPGGTGGDGAVQAGAPQPNLVSRPRVWFNPELKSRNYFIPGVVVNIIMIVTFSLTAQAMVREKEIGTMEQLMVTPIRPLELILGKTLPFALVGIFDMILVIAAALLIFRVPLRGNLFLLLLCSILFLFTTLGAGLFLSTISKTQQQAMMSSFLFTSPAFLLSGFMFPIRNMPAVIRWLTLLDPLRYFMDIVRGLFLKGAGISVLWPQMVALLIYGVAIMGLSVGRIHKSLD